MLKNLKLFNNKTLLLLCSIIGASLLVGGCNSQSNTIQTPEQIKQHLLQQIPEIHKIDSVTSAPINNLYQVAVGRQVFYITKDGKDIIFGNIIDVATKTNYTQQSIEGLSVIDWNKLPLNLAIKEVNGTGVRKIAVFSDPECPYCKMFEQRVVPALTNTTTYTFLFPLSIHPKAQAEVNAIWCNADRSKVWTQWMRNQIAIPTPSNPNCDLSGLKQIYDVGVNLVQVKGTPTIILVNGHVLPGMIPAPELTAKIDQALQGK